MEDNHFLNPRALQNEAKILQQENKVLREKKERERIVRDEESLNASIQVSGRIVTGKEIIARQKELLKRIPETAYMELPMEERLILDLPLIMLKLKDTEVNRYWTYSAYFMLHWLEGSGDELEIPVEFIENYKRTKVTKEKAIEELSKIEYASIREFNQMSSGDIDPDHPSLMYFVNFNSIETAYQMALYAVKTTKTEKPFGNFDFIKKRFKRDNSGEEMQSNSGIRMNFFRTYSIGSEFGDLDDLGGSFNRFSMRFFAKGELIKPETQPRFKESIFLALSEVAYVYADEFSFNGDQRLGIWKYDVDNPLPPEKILESGSNWYSLENETFRSLRSRGFNIGYNYYIKTKPTVISVEKDVEFIFVKEN